MRISTNPRHPNFTPSIAEGYQFITFVFRPTGFNTMVLSPLPSGHQPLYDITVTMNCLNPTSFVSTIRRSTDGEFVGEFEMGISSEKATIRYGDRYCYMEEIFHKFRKVPSKLNDRWIWEYKDTKLQWDGTGDETATRCYREGDKTKTNIAKLIPGSPINRQKGTVLEVYDNGRALMDHIVVSALIVERKRLSPQHRDKNESIFN